jgi:hypothetical protein
MTSEIEITHKLLEELKTGKLWSINMDWISAEEKQSYQKFQEIINQSNFIIIDIRYIRKREVVRPYHTDINNSRKSGYPIYAVTSSPLSEPYRFGKSTEDLTYYRLGTASGNGSFGRTVAYYIFSPDAGLETFGERKSWAEKIPKNKLRVALHDVSGRKVFCILDEFNEEKIGEEEMKRFGLKKPLHPYGIATSILSSHI